MASGGRQAPALDVGKAVRDADEALLERRDAAGSVAVWDKVIEARPDVAGRAWQRGLALYYAHRYAEGAAQFALDQHSNGADVEEALWHWLCRVAEAGVAAARADMLSVAPGDLRIPMQQVYQLYAGTGSEAAVMDAVDNPASASRYPEAKRRFYAHYYIALYLYALAGSPRFPDGRTDGRGAAELLRESDEHISRALQHRNADYMYRMCVMHQAVRADAARSRGSRRGSSGVHARHHSRGSAGSGKRSGRDGGDDVDRGDKKA